MADNKPPAPDNVHTILVFLRFFVLELGARTTQTDGRTSPMIRPVRTAN